MAETLISHLIFGVQVKVSYTYGCKREKLKDTRRKRAPTKVTLGLSIAKHPAFEKGPVNMFPFIWIFTLKNLSLPSAKKQAFPIGHPDSEAPRLSREPAEG